MEDGILAPPRHICTQGSEPVKMLPYVAKGDFTSIVVSTDLEMERLA